MSEQICLNKNVRVKMCEQKYVTAPLNSRSHLLATMLPDVELTLPIH